MFYDIVFPENNEKRFIETAEKLGIDGIAFAYNFKDKAAVMVVKKRIQQLQQITKVRITVVFEAEENKIYKVHDTGEKAIAKGNKNSRDVIARYKPDLVYDLELSTDKDFAKFRNSGLDKATCQFANKNNLIAAFSFSATLNTENTQKLLGRLFQNIKLCRKYKVKTAIASFAKSPEEMRSPHDLKSFLLAVGMYSSNAKKSIETVSEMIN